MTMEYYINIMVFILCSFFVPKEQLVSFPGPFDELKNMGNGTLKVVFSS